MTGRPAGLLFDLDGVLVDSTPDVVRHWQTFANEHGRDPAHVLARIHGRRTIDSIRELLADRPPAEIKTATIRHEQRELAEINGTIALPGAAQLLARLDGKHWAIVTSAPAALAAARLRAAWPTSTKVLVSAEHVERGKPDPQGYALAAQRLALTPAQCVVFEDTPAGIIAARAAGMRVVALATTHTAAQLRAAVGKLEWIAAALRELPDTLP